MEYVMDILTTPRELMDRGCWVEVANRLGINEYAVNEGQMSILDEIRVPEAIAREVGLLPAEPDNRRRY